MTLAERARLDHEVRAPARADEAVRDREPGLVNVRLVRRGGAEERREVTVPLGKVVLRHDGVERAPTERRVLAKRVSDRVGHDEHPLDQKPLAERLGRRRRASHRERRDARHRHRARHEHRLIGPVDRDCAARRCRRRPRPRGGTGDRLRPPTFERLGRPKAGGVDSLGERHRSSLLALIGLLLIGLSRLVLGHLARLVARHARLAETLGHPLHGLAIAGALTHARPRRGFGAGATGASSSVTTGA